ncbi:MAG TPA: Na+/H+ antiporter NhaA [Puia sp.]|uniref:Na+/H+ antiporter NhaA n=1 Tax=Puia sp. TaxID=2045100 RepID=UPI002B7503BF|nr:Na+/H+ antiporter NhaA [Puia sp.]HVU94929.1 Na+/H+ antiporter NhaA [Puia sp.]
MALLTAQSKSHRHPIMTPLRDFLNDSRSTGVLLIGCTLVSLVIANSTGSGWYTNGWKAALPGHDTLHLPSSPIEWVNNFLMAFFFLLAGMEIKRELLNGELSSFKKAILPFGAAFGGMLFPALIYTAFNLHTQHAHGWGIPTATDIAFSVGIASLLGKRFPVGLKILLLALAIIDDLGAIIVIALFYGGHVHPIWLAIAGLIYGALLLCNFLKVKFGLLQIILGLALWYGLLQSGVEATISGVLFAFAMPVKHLALIEKFIHKPVNFFILPLFALANTAILLPAGMIQSLGTTVGIGIICGLVIGKPLGIFLVSRLMVACNIAHLPSNTQWNQLFGMGTLAGIGFTMSIFTTMLAFGEGEFSNISKISILASVLCSLVVSLVYFRVIGGKRVTVALPITQPEPQADINLTAA